MTDSLGEAVAALSARAHREIDEGLLPSCQWALARDGEVIAGETLGDATPDSRYAIFSATKAIVASTFWTFLQDGEVDAAQRVRDFLPDFMIDGDPERGGQITVEQVMLHTSGFPHAPMGADVWWDGGARVERMRRWRCNHEPGEVFEYHATSAHWVLAEIMRAISGLDHRQLVHDRVLGPLGLDRIGFGVAPEDQGDVTTLVAVGEPPTPEELQALFGLSELPATEVTEDALLGFNDPKVRELGVPGGGAVSDAASLARFYQALLHDPADLWDPALLRDVTGNVRNTLPDLLTGVPVQRTLGLCTSGGDGRASFRGFGKTQSAGAFGHNGAGGQIAWADPETGVSFVYLTNGLDAHTIRQARRGVALSSLAGQVV